MIYLLLYPLIGIILFMFPLKGFKTQIEIYGLPKALLNWIVAALLWPVELLDNHKR